MKLSVPHTNGPQLHARLVIDPKKRLHNKLLFTLVTMRLSRLLGVAAVISDEQRGFRRIRLGILGFLLANIKAAIRCAHRLRGGF